jgi:hypothetical protein
VHQITLTLRDTIKTGKKTERLSIPCSEEFLALVDQVSRLKGTTRAEFSFGAVLKEIQNAIGEIFLTELHGDETVAELAAGGNKDQVRSKYTQYPKLDKEVIP